MTQLPDSLDHAIAQAIEATQSAIADGRTRIQIELLFPEVKVMPLAQQFIAAFADMNDTLRVFFPDPGAAALARRDWGETPYAIRGIGELKAQIQPNEQLFLFIEPSSVEVQQVEQLCQEAGDRPVVMLMPRMDDVMTIGIGYAARQLRERFLNQFEASYYIRPLDKVAVFRTYPSLWQVWIEDDQGDYQLFSEESQKPVGDALEQILLRASGSAPADPSAANPTAAKLTVPSRGLLGNLKQFLRALSQ